MGGISGEKHAHTPSRNWKGSLCYEMGTYQKNCDFRPGLACGFFLTVLAGFFPFAAASEELPQNIVRLHVVANSDSEEDQAVKLLVRDAVLEEAARWYGDARTMEEASARLCTHLESIAKTSQATLRGAGDGLFRNGPGDGDVLSHPGL